MTKSVSHAMGQKMIKKKEITKQMSSKMYYWKVRARKMETIRIFQMSDVKQFNVK